RNSAAYVGRVGGLAVALGIGTAVFTGHGVALADTADGGSGPKAADSSEGQSGPATGKPAESGGRGTGRGDNEPQKTDTGDSGDATKKNDNRRAESGSGKGTSRNHTDAAKPGARPQRKSTTTVRKPPKSDDTAAGDAEAKTPDSDAPVESQA